MDEIDLESPQMLSMGSDWFPLKPNIVKILFHIVKSVKSCLTVYIIIKTGKLARF